jgi:hypothetical protein
MSTVNNTNNRSGTGASPLRGTDDPVTQVGELLGLGGAISPNAYQAISTPAYPLSPDP